MLKKYVPHILILQNNFIYSCHLAKKWANCTKMCSRMSADAIFFKGGSCQKMNRDMIVLLDNSENNYLYLVKWLGSNESPQFKQSIETTALGNQKVTVYIQPSDCHTYRSTQIPSLFAGSISKKLSYPHDIIRTCCFSTQEVQYIKGHT